MDATTAATLGFCLSMLVVWVVAYRWGAIVGRWEGERKTAMGLRTRGYRNVLLAQYAETQRAQAERLAHSLVAQELFAEADRLDLAKSAQPQEQ